MEKAQEIIRLEDIFKIYRVGNQEVRALDGVSLSVFRNEYVAIMGPQVHVDEYSGLSGFAGQRPVYSERDGCERDG